MAGKKFNVSEPSLQLAEILKQNAKYTIKATGYSFHDIKNLKPVFAFDYLSFEGSDLCFNNTGLECKDYIGLFHCLKDISNKTYQELKETKNYRFHAIDFDDERVSLTKDEFKLKLVPRTNLLRDEELPTLYQIDINYTSAARACGFLFKGVFYLVWFDRFHKIYPRG